MSLDAGTAYANLFLMAKIPADAARVEMMDGRIYYSTDNWHTVFIVEPGRPKARKLSDEEADLARFLAVNAG